MLASTVPSPGGRGKITPEAGGEAPAPSFPFLGRPIGAGAMTPRDERAGGWPPGGVIRRATSPPPCGDVGTSSDALGSEGSLSSGPKTGAGEGGATGVDPFIQRGRPRRTRSTQSRGGPWRIRRSQSGGGDPSARTGRCRDSTSSSRARPSSSEANRCNACAIARTRRFILLGYVRWIRIASYVRTNVSMATALSRASRRAPCHSSGQASMRSQRITSCAPALSS